MNFPLFIAKRLYSDQGDKRKVSRPAIHIATAGVAIGLAIMIMSVCVVLGFKHTIRDKVIGFGSHIQVADFMTLQQQNQYPVVMNDSMVNVLKKIPGVKHVQKFAMKEGILKTDSDFLGVMFKGVGPDFDSTFIHQNMIEGSIPKFDDKASHNQILISQLMADKLKLKTGERIFAYFFDGNGVRMRRFTIKGIYQTNLKNTLDVMMEANKKINRIPALTETGCRGISQKQNWFTQTLWPVLQKYQLSYVLFWRNAWDKPQEEAYLPGVGDGAIVEDFKAFKKEKKVFFVKDIKKVK